MKKHQVNFPANHSLSKNQLKKVSIWNEEIMHALTSFPWPQTSNPLEVLLEKYHKEDPVGLGVAINTGINKYTPLHLACDLCVKKLKDEHELSTFPKFKSNVLLLLQYGANPNGGAIHALNILCSDVTLGELPPSYEFKYAELVSALIDKGADLTIAHRGQMTLAHFAAALDRKRVVLRKILDAQPDLLFRRDSMGEHPLTTAIRFGNTAAALDILIHYEPKIDDYGKQGATALSASVFYVDPIAAENLLSRGAGIHHIQQMTLIERGNPNEGKKITRLLSSLAKAGAFVSYNGLPYLHAFIKKYLKIDLDSTDGFFMILEDQDTKHEEIIYTFEALSQAKSKLSPEKLKRLHQSFLQMHEYHQADKSPLLEVLRVTYENFCLNYPCPEALVENPVPPEGETVPSEIIHGLGYLCILARDASHMKNFGTELMESFLDDAKMIVEKSKNDEYEQARLRDYIEAYSKVAYKIIMANLDVGHFTPEFERLFSKLNSYFLSAVAARFVKAAKTREEILEAHDSLLFFTSMTASYLFMNESKSMDFCFDTIAMFIKKYQELEVHSNKTINYIVMSQILKLRVYADLSFYPAVLSMMNEIEANETALRSEYDRVVKDKHRPVGGDIFANLDKSLKILIEKLLAGVIDSLTLSLILLKAEFFAANYELTKTAAICAAHRPEMMRRCEASLVSAKILPLEFEESGWFKLIFREGQLRIHFKEEISKTRIKYLFRAIDEIESDGDGYFIQAYGRDLDELQGVLDQLKSIDSNPLVKIERPVGSSSSAPQEAPIFENDCRSKYLQEPLTYSSFSSSSSSSRKAPMSKQKEKAKSSVEKQADLEEKRARIKREIAQKQQVSEDQVFPIAHPHFPEDKTLHAWAVWGEIKGDRGVDDKVLQEHRDTAAAGRFCVNQGQQGLKSVKINHPETGALVWSIKTKRLGARGDARIVAIPEDFHSEALHENVKIYRFGEIRFHK